MKALILPPAEVSSAQLLKRIQEEIVSAKDRGEEFDRIVMTESQAAAIWRSWQMKRLDPMEGFACILFGIPVEF